MCVREWRREVNKICSPVLPEYYDSCMLNRTSQMLLIRIVHKVLYPSYDDSESGVDRI